MIFYVVCIVGAIFGIWLANAKQSKATDTAMIALSVIFVFAGAFSIVYLLSGYVTHNNTIRIILSAVFAICEMSGISRWWHSRTRR